MVNSDMLTKLRGDEGLEIQAAARAILDSDAAAPELKEEAYMQLARLEVKIKRWGQALSLCEKGLALRRRTSFTPYLHFYYGAGSVWAGDPGRAVTHLHEVIRSSRKDQSLEVLLGSVWYYLGRAHRILREVDRELNAWRRAAGFFEAQGDPQWAFRSRTEAAWTMLLNGQIVEAERVIRLFKKAPPNAPKAVPALALYHFLKGDHEKASSLCTEIMRYSGYFSVEQLCDTLWVLAQVYRKTDQQEIALQFAHAAYAYAAKEPCPTQMRRLETLLSEMTEEAAS